MRALKMLAAHNPAMGLYADCVRTALACLLDCNTADEVPHFFENYAADDGDGSKGWDRADAWLRDAHKLALYFVASKGSLSDVLEWSGTVNPDTYYLLCGQSSNGGNHCVIGLNDQIIHDPSWSNLGVVAPSAAGHFLIIVLIPAMLKVKPQ